jgi:hypothetical protein
MCTLKDFGDKMNEIALKILNKTHGLINSKSFKDNNRTSAVDFTRSRKMNFKKMICFCLNFVKKSLQLELDNFIELLDEEIEKPITKQAFSKARQKISPKAFEGLFLMTADTMLNHAEAKKYKGYRLFAVDGSEIELNPSQELGKAYPPTRNTTAPRARISIMCDVLNESIIHADMQSLKTDERTLALRHLEHYKETAAYNNGVFIFDRGYPSKDLLEYFENNSLKYLMRLQKSFNAEIDTTKKNDFYVKIKNGKTVINVRVIKLTLPSGEEEVLITNLARNKFKKTEFQHLYHLRWGVETKYNTIKNKLRLEDFSGKTVVSVLQDFYAAMYLSNFVAAVKGGTDKRIADDTKNLVHEYKTNENLLIGKLKNNLVLILLNDDPEQRTLLLNKLMERVVSFKVAVVPDRHFPRPTEAHKKTRSRVKRVL